MKSNTDWIRPIIEKNAKCIRDIMKKCCKWVDENGETIKSNKKHPLDKLLMGNYNNAKTYSQTTES